ncbi:MAG: hypothetical protein HYW50_03325 [Candidatus Diapherotrites archaeon]|nr:hypothetical protein [Candidatus Diapherotrites archaeon]
MAADAVIEKLKLLEQQNSHHEGHEHAKPHFIGLKKALQIRKTLAQRETVAELIVELNNLRATKEHGYVFDPKVQPGFSHVSYPPTRTGILKWILGSKITFVGIRQPAYKTKVPKIFSKIPIIKKLPLDDLVSEAVNFVTFPWRRRNLNLAYLTDQQMNEIGKKINVEMLKLQRLEQRISKRDERAMYQAYMQLVAGAARKGSGGGREN